MRVLGRNLAPGDIVSSNRNPQYLQPSGRNPFPLAQRRTLRSVDLPQGAIKVLVEVYLESGAARSSGARDEHDRGAGWCGHSPRITRKGNNEVVPQSSVARPRKGIYYLCQVQGVVYCSKRDGCIGACKPPGNKRPP